MEIHFSDDGRGFEGDASKLGRLFQRGSSSRSTGVGLYLVRVLMERMGGRSIRCRPRRRFMPRCVSSAARTEWLRPRPRVPVLLLEDDANVAGTLTSRLTTEAAP